ncbi:MAG: hypothetical protein WAM66_07580 [Acidobacteriaceae bacterium]
MSRDLDSSMAAALPAGAIAPAVLAMIQFKSGTSYIWTGVGDLVYAGNTYKGVGMLGKLSSVVEGVDVRADGVTVALSGIGAAAFASAAPPSGVANPVAPSAGEYVAWVYPTAVTTANQDAGGTVVATLDSAQITMGYGGGGDTWGHRAVWSGFPAPALPSDAVITRMIPVALVSGAGSGAFIALDGQGVFPGGSFSGQYAANSVGTTLAGLESAQVTLNMARSLGGTITQTLSLSFIGVAVYYTSANNAIAFINEALSDVQLGAPAKLWFGLMAGGALVGTPYLIFSGLVDQPTVDMDAETTTISLALENRLSDLSRPGARRYTAADQRLKYPDDTAFNWVEILNDIALRWGS